MNTMKWIVCLASIVTLCCLGDVDPVIDVTPEMGLLQARDMARAQRTKLPVGKVVTIRLAPGRYEISEKLSLDGRDSNVIWSAVPGAEVRISGGLLDNTTAAESVTSSA